jgi:excisionase family DNA binding protein
MKGKTMAELPILFSPVQAAKILGISRSQVYVLMTRGELSSLKIGRSRKIAQQQMTQFINDLMAA